ncbi:MAG: choice-of-anchor U domain-containing protein [Thermodesulfobacteriota bacterium]
MGSYGRLRLYASAAGILFAALILGSCIVGCDGKSYPNSGADLPQAQVVLNPAGNVANVTYGDKAYVIDVSARPGATLDGPTIDVKMPEDFPARNFPTGFSAPDHLLAFTVKGLNPGETIVVTITFPTVYPLQTWYYKANDVGFFQFHGAAIVGNTVQLTLTDGGAGDDDDVPGQITDPGGCFLDLRTGQGVSPSRNHLVFGAVGNNTFTDSQPVFLQNLGPGPTQWWATAPQGWNVEPASGVGGGGIHIWPDPSLLPDGYSAALVSLATSGGATYNIDVALNKYPEGTTVPPFGGLDVPPPGGPVSSVVPVTGWVLDDIQVQNVEVYRNSGQGDVLVGYAVFTEGSRPDKEASYPGYPYNGRAGWGFMLLTNFLPDGQNTITAIAEDKEGNRVDLGSRSIVVDNANAVKPFGAIDTPYGPCGPLSGTGESSGWVLTPQPNTIPIDGSTINVFIDGVNQGHPTYNLYRQDIANLFMGYENSQGAGALYTFDTTAYANGIHTIQWVATDNAGNVDGIGSRYFSIQNTGSSP